MLAQDGDVIILVQVSVKLHQVSQCSEANAAPEHDSLSWSAVSVECTAWRISLMFVPPDKHPTITLPNRNTKLVTKDNATPVLSCSPVLDHTSPSQTLLANTGVRFGLTLCNTAPEPTLKKSEI